LAGLLLLEAGGEKGWLFLMDTEVRRASWWRWAEGGPTEFLLGVPFQKPLLAQAQSLLRAVLRGHHGALLLLVVGWLLNKGLRRVRLPELRPIPARYLVWLVGLLVLGAAVIWR
jgi:hypothetical protein